MHVSCGVPPGAPAGRRLRTPWVDDPLIFLGAASAPRIDGKLAGTGVSARFERPSLVPGAHTYVQTNLAPLECLPGGRSRGMGAHFGSQNEYYESGRHFWEARRQH